MMMEYVYPYMTKLEPIFEKYGYKLDYSSKLSIAALHQDYYIKDRQIAKEIRLLMDYAIDLKYQHKALYIDKVKIESPYIQESVVQSIENRISQLLFPDKSVSIKRVKVAFTKNLINEIKAILLESEIDINLYLRQHIENIINDSKRITTFLNSILIEQHDYGFAKFGDIDIQVGSSFCSIWAWIMKIQLNVCDILHSYTESIPDDITAPYVEIDNHRNVLNGILKKNKQSEQHFAEYFIWKIKSKMRVDSLDMLEQEEQDSSISSVLSDFIYCNFNDFIKDYKSYISIRHTNEPNKKEIRQVCTTLIRNTNLVSWKEENKRLNRLLKKYCMPIYDIIYHHLITLITNSLKTEIENKVNDKTTHTIWIEYGKELEKQYDKYQEQDKSLATYSLKERELNKRNKVKEIASLGVNYSLAAQYIYTILSGNIVASTETSTPLKQIEGAAIYDILTTLGFIGGRLNLGDYDSEEKAKYQSIRPCFRLNKSGGYNI